MLKRIFKQSEPGTLKHFRAVIQDIQEREAKREAFFARAKQADDNVKRLEAIVESDPENYEAFGELVDAVSLRENLSKGIYRASMLSHGAFQKRKCELFAPAAKDALADAKTGIQSKLKEVKQREAELAEELDVASADGESPAVRTLQERLTTANRHFDAVNVEEFKDVNVISKITEFLLS